MKVEKDKVKGSNLLPEKSGIYKFFNKDGVLIYVGKAKNIKKRVGSYFSKKSTDRKTYRLVREINSVEYTISNSEFDAFLLENNLIKANQPKYNILLKDDKTFPYICVLNEPFPRIIKTRKYKKENGTYYGPYTSVVAMNSVLDLVRKLHTIRTCNLNLSKENVKEKKFKVCLEYHIGNCLGPCEAKQSEEDYLEQVSYAEEILKGNISVVKNFFKEKMSAASENLEFERAQYFKIKLDLLEKFQTKTVVVNPDLTNILVGAIISDEKQFFVSFLTIDKGAINFTKSFRVKRKLEETESDILRLVPFQLLDQSRITDKIEYLSHIELDGLPENFESRVPQIGDKKKLVEIAFKNALQLKNQYISSKNNLKVKNTEVLTILQEDLNLKSLPTHIECFDNSNLQGSNPVASMVYFKNGEAFKKEYRHYNIKTVIGPDDFSSMKEVVGRRYKHLLNEKIDLPDLIIVDGGKGQLSSAVEALRELEIYGEIPIIGIAKRLEEIYFPEDQLPLHISKKSPSLKLIQKIRDEAHRFAITFHRQKRSKNTFNSSLEKIEGVGKKTAQKLLREFKSLKKIKETDEQELQKVVGPALAKKIKTSLK